MDDNSSFNNTSLYDEWFSLYVLLFGTLLPESSFGVIVGVTDLHE
jgi:hypothetical protein